MPASNHWYLIKEANIETLKTAFQDERLKWVYAERMEDTVLANKAELLEGSVDLSSWKHGRVFGPDLEIAWWQSEKGLDVRAYIENESLPEGIRLEVDPLGSSIQLLGMEDVLLFGEHDAKKTSQESEPAWSTARIPRYLYYPVGNGAPNRVALTVAYYLVEGMRREQRLVRISGGESDG